MSAFVVEDATITSIVSHLSLKLFHDPHYTPATPLIEMGYDLHNDKECKRLAEDMFQMNCDAVDARYGEGAWTEFHPEPFEWTPIIDGDRPIWINKAIRCYLYQCSERDVFKCPLFEALEQTALLLAQDIVYDLPEWDQAPTWR